jgi:hypothetical protein
METASTIIKDTLQEIRVQAAEAPIEAVESQDAIRYLNRMMSALAAKGISLGFTKIKDLGDPVTVPDGALEGIVFNLAIRLGNSYGFPIGQTLFNNASESMKAMIELAVSIGPTQYPETLPRGSGNSDFGYTDNHFYPGDDAAILTENNGFISIESETDLP